MARQKHHLLAVGELRADQFILGIEIDRDDSRGSRVGELRELGLFYRAVAGREENIAAGLFQIPRRHYGGELLVFLEAHEVIDRPSARGRSCLGNFVHLQPIDPAFRREQQNVAVRRGDKEVLDEILLARSGADAALAAARLVTIDVDRSALDVARVAHGNGHLLVFDQVLDLDFLHAVHDLRATVVAIGLEHLPEFGDDHAPELLIARQDFTQLPDLRADFCELLQDFIDREPGQAMELEFEDGVDLDVAEADHIGRQPVGLPVDLDAADVLGGSTHRNADRFVLKILVQVLAGVRPARRTPNDSDNVIHVVERDVIAEQDVLALLGFSQFVLRAPADHIGAVLDEQTQQLEQSELARLPGNDREQNHAKRFLQLRLLVEMVQNELRLGIALYLDHDAHPLAVALVPDIGNAVDFLVLDQLRDVLDQPRLVHLVRQLGDDDVLAILAALLDGRFRPHLN